MADSKLKIWIDASRPKTLWAAAAPVIIGTAMAFEAGGFHLPAALAAAFGAIMIQIGTNFANDFFDYKKGADKGERLGPTRATQAGLVTPSAMKRATFIAFALAMAAGLYLVWRGGLPIVIIGLLSILFGILYTAGRYALGYTGFADLFVLIFFGPVAVGGTYFVQTLDINWIVILAGASPGLFSVAILTVNNLRDIDGDKSAGKKTLPVRFGATFARFEYLLSLVIAAFVPVVIYQINANAPYSTLTLLVLLAAYPTIKTVFTKTGVILNDVLASTGKLLLLYSLIFSAGWLL